MLSKTPNAIGSRVSSGGDVTSRRGKNRKRRTLKGEHKWVVELYFSCSYISVVFICVSVCFYYFGVNV